MPTISVVQIEEHAIVPISALDHTGSSGFALFDEASLFSLDLIYLA